MAIGLNSSKLSLAAPPLQSPFVLPSSPVRFGQNTKMRQRESPCPSYSICASTAFACGSQNTMSIAPYNVMAAAMAVRACSRRPVVA